MKLAVNKKNRGSFLNLYFHELDGIFLPTIITTILLVIFKEGSFGLNLYNIKQYSPKGNRSLKMIFESNIMHVNNLFYDLSSNFLFYLSFALILIATMAFYIWFKEWFGRKKTIMTLMTLPISRLKIILSKLLAVITYGFIVLGGVFTTLFIEDVILKYVIKIDVNMMEFIVKNNFPYEFPLNFKNIFLIISLSITAISFIFLLIMINRSSLILGTIIDIALIVLAFILGIIFLVLSNFIFHYAYLNILILCSIIATVILITITNLLLKNNVHV